MSKKTKPKRHHHLVAYRTPKHAGQLSVNTGTRHPGKDFVEEVTALVGKGHENSGTTSKDVVILAISYLGHWKE